METYITTQSYMKPKITQHATDLQSYDDIKMTKNALVANTSQGSKILIMAKATATLLL